MNELAHLVFDFVAFCYLFSNFMDWLDAKYYKRLGIPKPDESKDYCPRGIVGK